MYRTVRLALVGALLASFFAFAPAALASGGGGDVRASGACSGASTWKLKAKPDDAGLQVSFEVDQNVNGVTWNVSITDNGSSIFSGTATTKARSGSFTVRLLAPNQPGSDSIAATATNPATGETCSGSLAI